MSRIGVADFTAFNFVTGDSRYAEQVKRLADEVLPHAPRHRVIMAFTGRKDGLGLNALVITSLGCPER